MKQEKGEGCRQEEGKEEGWDYSYIRIVSMICTEVIGSIFCANITVT